MCSSWFHVTFSRIQAGWLKVDAGPLFIVCSILYGV